MGSLLIFRVIKYIETIYKIRNNSRKTHIGSGELAVSVWWKVGPVKVKTLDLHIPRWTTGFVWSGCFTSNQVLTGKIILGGSWGWEGTEVKVGPPLDFVSYPVVSWERLRPILCNKENLSGGTSLNPWDSKRWILYCPIPVRNGSRESGDSKILRHSSGASVRVPPSTRWHRVQF